MKPSARTAGLWLGALLLGSGLLAQGWGAPGQGPLTLKLGTLVPGHSTWDDVLREMAARWLRAGVDLRIYGNGVLGDEPDIITKMRIGQIQLGLVTVVGLSRIDQAAEVLSVPMLYKDDAESDYVRSKLQPLLEKRLEAKGFKVLNWGEAGWVYFFGQTPVLTPGDLKKMRFFVWGDDAATLDLWQSAGFSPIPLSPTDILPGLQTGMINCFDTTPIAALAFQWFAEARHMTDLKWAPLVGATIINTSAWDKVPAGSRPALLEAAAEAGRGFRDGTRKNSAGAIEAMKEHGLVVHEINAGQYAQWQSLFEGLYPQMAGRVIPADILKLAIHYRDEYRAKAGNPGAGEPSGPGPK